jgi:MoaA/NifB/PqqE/SkfB family radical SAM enzyme
MERPGMQVFDIKLGFACNNHCLCCLVEHVKEYRAFPWKMLTRHIENSAQSGCRNLIVSGGEPSVNPDFIKLLHFAKDAGFQAIQIQTNGRMMSYEAFVKKIMEVRPMRYSFLISLHFPEKELYNSYTRSDGFDQVISGIKNLVKNGLSLKINTVVMKPNLGLLGDITDLVRSLGVKRQQFRMIDGHGVREYYDKFVPPISTAARSIRRVIEKNKCGDFKLDVHELPLCVLGRDMESHMSPPVNPDRVNMSLGSTTVKFTRVMEESFVFSDRCAACSYRSTCKGIRKGYSKIYGFDELKPIKKR